mmetsp:Transcript_77188/g.195983  ORF Transcript_77188/g.195983 Transcript_77188/m.195983 type:complete len:361 (-) Transcript_77188:35-1117(-)
MSSLALASAFAPTGDAVDGAEGGWGFEADLHQIRKDLPRSFPEEPMVQSRSHIIEAILVEHAKFDPELGYCQGMSCVAAVVAAQLTDPVSASLFFRRLVDSLRGLWLPGFPLLTAGSGAFDTLQRSFLPMLHEHIEVHGASYDMFLPDAWLTLFARWLPFDSLWTVLVFIEAEGLAGLLSLTAVLLQTHQAALLSTEDFTTLFVLLKTLGRQPEQPEIGELISAARLMLPEVRDLLPQRPLVPHPTCGSSHLPSSHGSGSFSPKAKLVRKGSRVLHASSNLEAIGDEWDDDALHLLAFRTMSMQSPVASPVACFSSRSQRSSSASVLPATRGLWFFASCISCCTTDRLTVDERAAPVEWL